MLMFATLGEILERIHNIPALYAIFGWILEDKLFFPDFPMWKKKIAFISSLIIYYSSWIKELDEIQKQREK